MPGFDNDSIPNVVETTDDVDGDGIPNFLDMNSDGDELTGSVEHSFGSDPYDPLDSAELPVDSRFVAALMVMVGALALMRPLRRPVSK